MKKYGFEKSKRNIHGHNECGICSGFVRSKTGHRQKIKRQVKRELDLLKFSKENK